MYGEQIFLTNGEHLSRGRNRFSECDIFRITPNFRRKHSTKRESNLLKFVFVKLKLVIPTDYPTVAPIWSAVNSRGLSDELLNNLLTEARFISESKIGHSMLYEVIEQLKDYLIEQNTPSEACCVCKCEFDTNHEYTKTNCFHFFHLAYFATIILLQIYSIKNTNKFRLSSQYSFG